MIDFLEEEKKQIAVIKVIGLGGAGGNTVNSIIKLGNKSIECIVANTDAQALETSNATHKVQIGIKSTKGLGAGANPDLGKRAAEEDLDKIMEAVGQADIVFLAGGMGGGTGSGALPVVARALKEHGILSIAVVTKPFLFEGKRRARVAEEAIEKLKKEVDTLIVVPNQKLFDVVGPNVSMIDAFSLINDILSQSVTGISDIITKPGHINVDFADVRIIMKDMGLAVLGTGRAKGEHRAREAALMAISSSLLENMSIDGARGVLLNITGSKDMSLHEISEAASVIYERADEDANIILGSVIDDAMSDEVCVTVIATGFSHAALDAVQQSLAQPVLTPRQNMAQQAIKQAVSVPVAPVIKEEELFAKLERSIEKVEVSKASAVVEAAPQGATFDASDLDVPTFMRNKSQENSAND